MTLITERIESVARGQEILGRVFEELLAESPLRTDDHFSKEMLAAIFSFIETMSKEKTCRTHTQWRNRIASDANIDSYIDNYLLPFLARNGSVSDRSPDARLSLKRRIRALIPPTQTTGTRNTRSRFPFADISPIRPTISLAMYIRSALEFR
jgi:hypothetical protein